MLLSSKKNVLIIAGINVSVRIVCCLICKWQLLRSLTGRAMVTSGPTVPGSDQTSLIFGPGYLDRGSLELGPTPGTTTQDVSCGIWDFFWSLETKPLWEIRAGASIGWIPFTCNAEEATEVTDVSWVHGSIYLGFGAHSKLGVSQQTPTLKFKTQIMHNGGFPLLNYIKYL